MPSSNSSNSNSNSNNNNNSGSKNNVSASSTSSTRVQAPSGGASLSPSSMLPSPSSSADDLTSDGGTTTVEDTEFYGNNNLPSLLKQVERETAYLKLGCPTYEIVPDPENPTFFAGRPVFKNSSRLPEGWGYVNGASTKNLVKERISEKILEFCKTERKRRESIMRTFNSPEGE